MTHEQLNSLPVWRQMPVISLDEMSAIKLMNRIDTKYVISERQCMELLQLAAGEYLVQVIGENRACRYSTLYYDTADWQMYTLHHNRHLTRQKIRARTYVESDSSFIEIKNKTNTGRTKKRRIPIPTEAFGDVTAQAEAADFLRENSAYAPETIHPSLMTAFERITLVNHARTERLTIDLNLRFVNVRADATAACTSSAPSSLKLTTDPDGGTEAMIEGMVIVELKQDGMCASPMRRIFDKLRIRPLSISKYCLGEALSNPAVKSNRFKYKIRRIMKIVNE